MKKALSLIAALALSVSMLAGCGGSSSSSSTIGVGVDANIITASRIKEELYSGKTLDGGEAYCPRCGGRLER